MSRSDGRILWRAIDRVQKREAAAFNREMTAIGRTAGVEFVARGFYDWAMAAKAEDVGEAVLQIARKKAADQKLLCAAKIAGIWE